MRALRTSFASIMLAAAGIAVLAAATDGFRAFTSESARRIAVREQEIMAPEVALQTQTGERINLSGLRGSWLLVDFMYTRCETLCFALGSDFARLERDLARPIAQGKLHLLSISFDPSRDTPQALADYLERFHAHGNWIAARPEDLAGLARLKRRFGIIVVPDGVGGYVHNTGMHLVDPRGRIVEILDLGAVERVKQRLHHYGVL